MMDERKLIFLISQPRSGSSLLQQMLSSHDSIGTCPESWLMLSLISTYRPSDIHESYNLNYTSINLKRFLDSINSYEEFKNDIKGLAFKYFSKSTEKDFFLDKTPRYFHIIEELLELFPSSKFIFLTRNPISVFSSILSYNFRGDLHFLNRNDRIDDLYKAPEGLLKMYKRELVNTYFLRYEDLLETPDKKLKEIQSFLSIDIQDLTTYKVQDNFKGSQSVDQNSLLHSTIHQDYISSWKKTIVFWSQKRELKKYIENVNSEYLDNFGYSKNVLLNEIDKHNTKFGRRDVKYILTKLLGGKNH